MKKLLIITGTLLALVILISPSITFAVGGSIGGSTYNLNVGTSGGVNSYGSTYGSNGSQCNSGAMTLCTLIERVIGYLDQALFLLIGLSVVVFVYYIFKYFIQPNEDRKQAGMYVMYSVIGFFVILSMWGLVNILQNTFGLGNVGYSHSSWTDIQNIFPR